jgi:hypothetical protein
MAQEAKHLLCKCKAMRSNPSPTKKKKEKVLLMGLVGVAAATEISSSQVFKAKRLR